MNESPVRHVIALAGGIGTGKAAALRMLAQLGYETIDADRLAAALLKRGSPGHRLLLDRFGDQVLDAHGDIDAARIYRDLRLDASRVHELHRLIDPLVKDELADLIRAAASPLLFIKTNSLDAFHLRELCDRIWVIRADPSVRLTNLVDEHGWPRKSAEKFIRAEPPLDALLSQADLVLENSGSHREFLDQLALATRQLDPQPASPSTPAPARLPLTRAATPLTPSPQPAPAVRPAAVGAASASAKRVPAVPRQAAKPPPAKSSLGLRQLRFIARRVSNSIFTLIVIGYLTSWGLILAEYGRQHLPILPLTAAWEALRRTGEYLLSHPATYFSAGEQVPWLGFVSRTLGNSAGLLLLSMGAALLVGLPLGVGAAIARRKSVSALLMSISVLGVSTASFLFAMLLWVANIWVHRTFSITVLPSAGYGWDAHLVMPVLVLAMRPMAQLAQVTYISMSEILRQDYIRTAHSKGLGWRAVRNVHVFPNILIPILNTLGSSLRFSLASLPVVEVFFDWPGVGVMLLDAINAGTYSLVIDLILSLGSFFLVVNLLIEFSYPLIDARLRRDTEAEGRDDTSTPLAALRGIFGLVAAWLRDFRQRFRRRERLPALILPRAGSGASKDEQVLSAPSQGRWMLRNFVRNPALIIGSITVLALLGLALFGENLTEADPYQVHGIMPIEGQFYAPPFEPSPVFPWGADHLGRDIRALVLAGGKRTLSLAFFGMLARLLLGSALGLLAGWQRDSWFDRLVTGAMGVWAAFPVTLFAMIVIQGLGIQQGMWVFVVAICIVGWGEVAQFVRGQVIALKPQAFIESARSVGARTDQILTRHVIPNLVNTFIVLASLEMAGVLMLLAELGFLNIFMGGGFRAMIGEAGRMMPVIAFYSDVPEWAALIANVRQYWRSYPWMALYPGLAVFLSVVGLNLFGEGLRRFLEECHVNLSRLFNRYTFMAGAALAVVGALVLQASGPLSLYRPEALKFDENRVMQDIQNLSALELQGRETGTPGAELASMYIAHRMKQIGIFPAGEHVDFYQRLIQPRLHLFEVPTLSLAGSAGAAAREFVYRQDFIEIGRDSQNRGTAQAPVMGVAFGDVLDPAEPDAFGLSNSDAMDHVIIVRSADLHKVNTRQVKGVLVIEDESRTIERRDLYPYGLVRNEVPRPHLLISEQVADSLLQTAGSSTAALEALRETLLPGEFAITSEGATVGISLEPRRADNYLEEAYINVLGVIPGQGESMDMDEQVIVVSAYYDGPGTDLTGQVYPGANDNASGVAAMLEIARVLKESNYQPDKTVLFAAWAGGERQEGLSVVNVLNARPGANKLNVESVIELSGVGAGTGQAVSIGNDSSYRLVKLFQAAAERYDTPTTTRGRGPHYDLPALNVFGGRDAMTLSLSWDGSDALAHTPRDVASTIDPMKLREVGRSALLTLFVLCRETDY